MINKATISPRGFTLLETLVAVLILTMAVTAPIYIAGKSLQTAHIAKDEITAYYLAQDAIEYIRFIRDTNTLCMQNQSCAAQSWLAGLDGNRNGHTNGGGAGGNCISSNGNATCTIDSVNDSVTSCNGACPPLNYDPTSNGGYYTYSSGTPSPFTRTISIVSPVSATPGTSEAWVTVLVTWKDEGSITHTVQVEEDLLNWQ